MVFGHPYIPDRDLAIFTAASEHVLVHVVESCAVEGLLRDLALDGAIGPTLPQIPYLVEAIITTGYELMVIVG